MMKGQLCPSNEDITSETECKFAEKEFQLQFNWDTNEIEHGDMPSCYLKASDRPKGNIYVLPKC